MILVYHRQGHEKDGRTQREDGRGVGGERGGREGDGERGRERRER